MSLEADPSRSGSQGTIALRPAMSFRHEVNTVLHSNIQTSLRRDGYPVTWSAFRKAWPEAF
eukprot:3843167-Alexandrium_andersonii.AAC.1